MFRTATSILAIVLVSGCYQVAPDQTYSTRAEEDAIGLAVTSSMLAFAGAPGLAFLPLLIAMDIHASNAAMHEARSKATLDQTYRYAYDRNLSSVGATGSTGVVFRDMPSATTHFRTVLRGYGVAMPEAFVLTAVRSADTKGYTLYALVHRPQQTIRVRTDEGRVRTLTPNDLEFYRPYRTDADGRLLDVVIDWAGVPRSSISTQKGQAILLTLAANSVLVNRRSDEYWSIEQRWLRGQYRQVVEERQREIDRRLSQG